MNPLNILSRLLMRVVVLCAVFSLMFGPGSLVLAQPSDMDQELKPQGYQPKDLKNNEEIHMLRGDLEAIKVYSLARIAVTNPEIADIANADSNQVLLLGKRAGQTTLIIWDEYGKRSVIVRVFDEDLNMVEKRVNQMLNNFGITSVRVEKSELEGKIVLTGRVPPEKKAEFGKAVEPFGSSVLNLVKIEPVEDLVQIDVQIAELNTSITKNLGIDWTTTDGGSGLLYTERDFNTSVMQDIFKVGPLSRSTLIMATVNTLIREGKGRVLSKPKLLVVNGKEASFQVGGEIPISTLNTTSGGNVTQNITFKDYGIQMTVTPTIKEGNKVSVVVNVEVSEPDASNSVGTTVAFTTRNAKTQLYLDDNQTVVLAGLIKQVEDTTVKKVPFLGDIPVLGFAFRTRNSNPRETELVISITPTIIPQSEPNVAVAKKTVNNDEEIKMTEAAVEKAAQEAAAQEAQNSSEILAGNVEAESLATLPTETEAVSGSPEAGSLAAETPSNDLSESMTGYIQSVQSKISESISFPYEAKEKGWQGTVKLALHILKDGTLADATVKESSGYEVFDNDALNTAQILAPYSSFPNEANLQELIVTIPIVYSQDVSLKSGVCDPNIVAHQERVFVPGGMAYSDLVQRRIAESLVYPQEAKENGWEGTVRLNMQILKDGTLAFVTVKESSGYKVFDDCAVQTAQAAAPFSGFPTESDLQEVNLTVPIVYNLKAN